MNKAVATPKSVGMSARRLERIRPAMQGYIDRGVYTGITTLIARRGQVVHEEQFGWLDKEAQSPMSADAIFRLYSMTKPIVCTGLMTLLEEGRFTLFDPLAKYIPAFRGVKVREPGGSLVNPVRPIHVRDLMTHTSGLTYHFVEDSPLIKEYQGAKLLNAECSLEAAIDDLARFPLAFQPGTRWRYSVGIDVVARVIEVISGRPLGAFLRERLFEPLGMVDTAFERSGRKRRAVSRRCTVVPTSSVRPQPWRRAGGLARTASTNASTFRRLTPSIRRSLCSRRPRPVCDHPRLLALRPDAANGGRIGRDAAFSAARRLRSCTPITFPPRSCPWSWRVAAARLRLRSRLAGGD